MKVRGKKTHRAGKSFKRYFPQSSENSCSTRSKSNKEVTLKTRKTFFFYRKPQKTKNCEKSFAKIFSNFCQFFSFGKTRSAKKTKSGHQCSQNALFLLKIEGGSLGSKKNLKKSIVPKNSKGGPSVIELNNDELFRVCKNFRVTIRIRVPPQFSCSPLMLRR